MKKFIVKANKYLDQDVDGYYNCDYVGYQKKGNPDFINKLKNMSRAHGEMDLARDYVKVATVFTKDLTKLIESLDLKGCMVCLIPRSKAENNYHRSQKLFKKALSGVVDSLNAVDGTNAIKRVKDTKTTHNWRLENNNGDAPYVGITVDTCQINKSAIEGKNIILVDDIYTHGTYIAEDCLQTLFDLGAKSVILYVVAKTRGDE